MKVVAVHSDAVGGCGPLSSMSPVIEATHTLPLSTASKSHHVSGVGEIKRGAGGAKEVRTFPTNAHRAGLAHMALLLGPKKKSVCEIGVWAPTN